MSEENPNPEGEAAGESKPVGQAVAAALEVSTCEQWMDKAHPVIDVGKSIGDAYDVMEARSIECLPIVKEGKVVKMITKNNVEIMRSVFSDVPGFEERLSRIMCLPLGEINPGQKLLTAKSSDPVLEVIKLMAKNKIHSVPVLTSEGELAGMITANGIFRSVIG